nr:hypothetical protein [Tanacetum cinerariifolium]
MDEALVPSAQRSPFYKVFLVTADVPEIYMQEFWATATIHHLAIRFKMDNKKHILDLETFRNILHISNVPEIYMQELWATATVHHHSIRFKMDNKKHIVNLEYFKEMLHICPRLPEEILDFIQFLGHSATIRTLTDVNINKLYQPWRSFELNAYKEYYAVATRATPPKPKASVWKTRSSSDTIATPLTADVGLRLSTSAKGKQPATTSKAKSPSTPLEVAITEAQQLKLATKRS